MLFGGVDDNLSLSEINYAGKTSVKLKMERVRTRAVLFRGESVFVLGGRDKRDFVRFVGTYLIFTKS